MAVGMGTALLVGSLASAGATVLASRSKKTTPSLPAPAASPSVPDEKKVSEDKRK